MKNKKALIVAGSKGDINFLKTEIHDKDYIVCVDKGYDFLKEIGIYPDILIGDLDSVDKNNLRKINPKINILKYPERKDYTDFELALKYLKREGFKYITVIFATGNRLDHELANMFLIFKYKDMSIKIKDENNEIFIASNKNILKSRKKHYVSIIPISNTGVLVNIKNALYEGEQIEIDFASSKGVSNEFLDKDMEIDVLKGNAFIIITKKSDI